MAEGFFHTAWHPSLGVSYLDVTFAPMVELLRPLEKFAAIIVLVVATLAVKYFHIQVELAASIATIPNSLPPFMLPDFSLIPQLALGSLSVALAQAPGISTAVPDPDGSKASASRDFVGEALDNLAGSFFQSMGTGG